MRVLSRLGLMLFLLAFQVHLPARDGLRAPLQQPGHRGVDLPLSLHQPIGADRVSAERANKQPSPCAAPVQGGVCSWSADLSFQPGLPESSQLELSHASAPPTSCARCAQRGCAAHRGAALRRLAVSGRHQRGWPVSRP